MFLAACEKKQQPHEPILPGEQTIFRDFGEPTWGPSGLIAYGHGRTTDSSGLWLMNEDGTNQRPFLVSAIDGIFSRPDWSPDGQWLALGKGAQIYKITVTKDSLVQLTTDPLRKFHPSWSPDGKWIAFSAGAGDPNNFGIWVVNSDGAEMRHIHCCSGSNPDWSPDGKKIVFPGWPTGSEKQKLLIMDAHGSNLKVLFNPSDFGFDYGVDHPSFSPDGRKIVFQTKNTETKDAQIWLVNVDGSNPRRLTSNGGIEPSWSPDGRWLVYVRFSYYNAEQTGNGKLWVMDANGKNKQQFTF